MDEVPRLFFYRSLLLRILVCIFAHQALGIDCALLHHRPQRALEQLFLGPDIRLPGPDGLLRQIQADQLACSLVALQGVLRQQRHRFIVAYHIQHQLQAAQEQRFRVIVTDGVFSMDGNVAPIDKICDLAEKYDALVMVDESHSAGVVGATGHGVSELCNTYGRVDIYTGTLGKAFGGALGGFTTGRKEIIDMLRQSSRPYLFSNSLAPSIIGASLEVFKMLKEDNSIHDRLVENVNYFRDKMMAAGFDIKPTQSAICAVMLYDAPLSQRYANRLLEEGIYVTGFYYPVVPKGEARIRVQLSAGHTREQLDKAIAAFIKIGKELGVLK